MYDAIVSRYHLPELCTCPHHQKVFTAADEVQRVSGPHELMQKLMLWNGRTNDACWQYALRELRHSEGGQVVVNDGDRAVAVDVLRVRRAYELHFQVMITTAVTYRDAATALVEALGFQGAIDLILAQPNVLPNRYQPKEAAGA